MNAFIMLLYDQSTAVQRRLLSLRFRVGEKPGTQERLSGTIVQIDRSPVDLSRQFEGGTDDRAHCTQRMLNALAIRSEQEWQDDADANKVVRTKPVQEQAGHCSPADATRVRLDHGQRARHAQLSAAPDARDRQLRGTDRVSQSHNPDYVGWEDEAWPTPPM
jgi:hypothetical protein